MNISIALATHNGRDYIEKQLESLLSQTLVPTEIIVSDDGSTDGTREFLKLYSNKHDCVRILDSREQGINCNFQNAVSACTGDLIAFCDQDDIWSEDKIRTLVSAFSDDVLLAYGPSVLVDETGQQLSISAEDYLGYQRYRDGHQPCFFHFSNCISGHTMLARRSLVELALPFPENCMYDQWLALIASTRSDILHVPQAITYHRIHSSNSTNNRKKNKENKSRRIKPSKFARYQQRQAKDLLLLQRGLAEGNTLTGDERHYLRQLVDQTQFREHQFFNIRMFVLLLQKRQQLFHGKTVRECRNRAIGGKYFKILDRLRFNK